MSIRSDELFLVDILESADALRFILKDLDFDTANQNEVIRSAALWRLYLIAEASSRLSKSCRNEFENVPWDQIRSFRSRMAHGYFSLEWKAVWIILSQDVPELCAQAERVLTKSFPDAAQRRSERRNLT